jgi:tetratricopeptide (TPR) repeat protein
LVWRIEFETAATKDLAKLDKQAARRIIAFLRERVAPLENPRTLGAALLNPSEPEYFDNRALSHAKEGKYDLAIIDYNEAIRISQRASFLTHRGDAYQAKGELDLAVADYDRAIKLDPAFADAYNNRGAAFRGKGDLDRAIADYEAALRINPQFETAAENLAAVRAQRKRSNTI